MKTRYNLNNGQFGIEYEYNKWPDQEQFPLNVPEINRRVAHILEGDLKTSNECLIITGFTSLSRIVDWFGTDKFNNLKHIKILLGNDPILRKRHKYPYNFVDIELKEYWLNKGISLRLGASVLNVIDKLQTNHISIRFKKRSHSKIYVGKEHAIMGSSNFSKSGLESQIEANIRESREGKYEEIRKIAELHYDSGKPYNDELAALLKELLADVTWEEALARAIAEVLEGRWFAEHNEYFEKLSLKKFWPTQYSGLIEAINILIDKGNVLIADPTGSGKTKMTSAIIISFIYWLWQTGEKFKSNLLLFSPPVVQSNWKKEFQNLDFLNYTLRSIGILSNTTQSHLKDILKELSLANVLVVDEAHNLLNPISNRSRNLATNKADYKILLTATPVYKKLEDLIRIIELLDVDNLTDTDFGLYKEIKENRKKRLTSREERENLKGFIDNFLVRRTKSELNEMIDKAQDQYLNYAGKQCRFPKVLNPSYKTGETDNDKGIVDQISALSSQLKGLNYLRNFEPLKYLVRTDKDRRTYILQRIEGAKNLAIYNIRACLRSSKVALLEYLLGTEFVNKEFQLSSNKNLTGNIIANVTDLKDSLPNFNFESKHFPQWLVDQAQYNEACIKEVKIYEQIVSLVHKLSSERENGKADTIRTLLETNNIVIAFDSKLITLDYLDKLLLSKDPKIKTFVATGSNNLVVDQVLKICEQGSQHKNVVILCSDKMSEGVNLQGASALILLDLPSVIRLVEQRIGRIDRMDTDHDEIQVLWPNDSDQFSLKGDKRLVNTSLFVNSTIGSNFEIPAELRDKHFSNVDDIDSIKQELEENKGEKGWEGSHNFFRPIQDLKDQYIDDETYELIKDVNSQIKTRVSFYESKSDWCFICTRGDIKQSPKWLYLEKNKLPINGFIEVARKLSENLPLISESRLEWDQEILDSFLKDFRNNERLLLPEKRIRVLEVAEYILKEKRDKVSKSGSRVLKNLFNNNISLFHPTIRDEITDYYSLSELWLEVLQPYLDNIRNRRTNRRKAFNLNELKK